MNRVPQETQSDKGPHQLGTDPKTPEEFKAAFAAAKEFGNEDELDRVKDLLRERLAEQQATVEPLAFLYGKHVSPHGYVIRDITSMIGVIPGEEGSSHDPYRQRLEEAFAVLVNPILTPQEGDTKEVEEMYATSSRIRSRLRNLYNDIVDSDVAGTFEGRNLYYRLLAADDLLNRSVDPEQCGLRDLRAQIYATFVGASSSQDIARHYAKLVDTVPAHGAMSTDHYAMHRLADVYREMTNAYEAANRAMGILDNYKDEEATRIEAQRDRFRAGGDNAIRLERATSTFVNAVALSKGGARSLRAIGVALNELKKRSDKGLLDESGTKTDALSAYLDQQGNRLQNVAWCLENGHDWQHEDLTRMLDAAERELETTVDFVLSADGVTIDGAADATRRALEAVKEAAAHHKAWQQASAYARACRTVVERRTAEAGT